MTGASGLLGANLVVTALHAGWSVSCVSATRRVRPEVTRSFLSDLSQPGVAKTLFEQERPTLVIHTAAGTDVNRCETDARYAKGSNVDMAREVALAARAVGARLLHISTDAVFGATEQDAYAEEDPPAPCNAYGRSKLAGEAVVAETDPSALVVRTTIYGWNAQPKSSLAEYFLGQIRGGREAPGFEDAWMSPILANDLAERLLQLSEMQVTGTLHVAGSQCISKAEFGRHVARAFDLDPRLVVSAWLADVGLPAPRPRRACLRVGRAEAMLGRMPTVEEGLARMRELEGRGLREELRELLEEM